MKYRIKFEIFGKNMIANIEADGVTEALAKFAIKLAAKADVTDVEGPGMGENEWRDTMTKELDKLAEWAKAMALMENLLKTKRT